MDRSFKGSRTESNPMFSSSWISAYPPLQGKWSSDTGWVAMQDGVSQEAWSLIRIGNGPALDLARRFQPPRWMVVHPGDRWVWKRTTSWIKTLARDTIRGVEIDTVRWKAVERVGDSGVRGRWRFERSHVVGGSIDTSVVDFDSPFTQAEPSNPPDLDLTVFRRGGAPSWYLEVGDNGTIEYLWSSASTTTYSGGFDTTFRRYTFANDLGVIRMEQSHRTRTYGPETGNPSADTSIVVELLSFNGTSSTKPISIPRRTIAPISSRNGLDRFLASGGRILSIREASGRSVPSGTADPAAALRSRRGLVFIETIAPNGERFAVRFVLP